MIKFRNNRRRNLRGIVLILTVLMMLLPATTTCFATYTKRLVPASKSCVRKTYRGKVVIFAGDSRTMHMADGWIPASVRKNCAFVWMNGGSVNCIRSDKSLAPYLRKMIRKYRDRCIVVFNFGVNGNSNPEKNAKRLIRIYHSWMEEYPDVTFYVESINPTAMAGGSCSNQGVIETNDLLQEEFEDCYIDIYTYLISKKLVDPDTGAGTRDGLHYERAVYQKIIKKVRSCTMNS